MERLILREICVISRESSGLRPPTMIASQPSSRDLWLRIYYLANRCIHTPGPGFLWKFALVRHVVIHLRGN